MLKHDFNKVAKQKVKKVVIKSNGDFNKKTPKLKLS